MTSISYKNKYLKYKSKYFDLKNQIGGSSIEAINSSLTPINDSDNVFYIYTTGIAYNDTFKIWNEYIRDNIIDNILINYNKIVIKHSDILFGLDDADKQDKLLRYQKYIDADIKKPKIYSSLFTYMSLEFDKLHAKHNGKDYIVFDFAHVIRYIYKQPYDNSVYIKLYSSSTHSPPFILNSVYSGVVGDGDMYDISISKQLLFNVNADGIVTTYIKTLFDKYGNIFKDENVQLVFKDALDDCQKKLINEWRPKYSSLATKTKHPYKDTMVDFDELYKDMLTDDILDIYKFIFNLYCGKDKYTLQQINDKIYGKIKLYFCSVL